MIEVRSSYLGLSFFLLLSVSGLVHAQLEPGQPVVKATKVSKLATCPGEGGLKLEEGYVKATRNTALVDIVVYIQHYHGDWERKVFQRQGSGPVDFNLASCDYTGNYYLFAVYNETGQGIIPTKSQVVNKHASLGTVPKFRLVEKKDGIAKCPGGKGVELISGEIFTPAGEAISLTLFLEKTDGSWRKKHYPFTGSGPIMLDILDCELTGNFKTKIEYVNK